MALVFQWLVRLTAGLIVLAVLGVGMIYYLASRSLPDYDATLRVDGLAAETEIVRDNANVPHILAQTDADAFFALGFVHAQDRLWQMMLLRRTAQGRLSEVFGAPTVETDSFIRRLDIYRLAVQSVAVQTPQTITALEAYSAGVNARIAQINDQALGRGAPEFFVFPMALAPWQPADSLAIGKLMALQLSGQLDAEVMRARMSLALPDPARLVDILPDAPAPVWPPCLNMRRWCRMCRGMRPWHRKRSTRCRPSAPRSLPVRRTHGRRRRRGPRQAAPCWPTIRTWASAPPVSGIWRGWTWRRAG